MKNLDFQTFFLTALAVFLGMVAGKLISKQLQPYTTIAAGDPVSLGRIAA